MYDRVYAALEIQPWRFDRVDLNHWNHDQGCHAFQLINKFVFFSERPCLNDEYITVVLFGVGISELVWKCGWFGMIYNGCDNTDSGVRGSPDGGIVATQSASHEWRRSMFVRVHLKAYSAQPTGILGPSCDSNIIGALVTRAMNTSKCKPRNEGKNQIKVHRPNKHYRMHWILPTGVCPGGRGAPRAFAPAPYGHDGTAGIALGPTSSNGIMNYPTAANGGPHDVRTADRCIMSTPVTDWDHTGVDGYIV